VNERGVTPPLSLPSFAHCLRDLNYAHISYSCNSINSVFDGELNAMQPLRCFGIVACSNHGSQALPLRQGVVVRAQGFYISDVFIDIVRYFYFSIEYLATKLSLIKTQTLQECNDE
jgi:hypothetical protein